MVTQRKVMVWGRPHDIEVDQHSKSVWIAVGEYMGRRVEGKGQSKMQAVLDWQRNATYKGNL
jgi:hypothetical protein